MNWFPSDQLGLAMVSITSRPSSVGIRPTLNCRPFPLAVGTFRVTYRCGRSAGGDEPCTHERGLRETASLHSHTMASFRAWRSDELHQTASGSGWSCRIPPPEAVSLRITADPISCVSG